jgi:hypothetical protein
MKADGRGGCKWTSPRIFNLCPGVRYIVSLTTRLFYPFIKNISYRSERSFDDTNAAVNTVPHSTISDIYQKSKANLSVAYPLA